MVFRGVFDLVRKSVYNREHSSILAQDNYGRLLIGSIVVLMLELVTITYVYTVFGQVLYLPLLLIPLCLGNIVIWQLDRRGIISCGVRCRQTLVLSNILIALGVGGSWNVVMQGTPEALSIYMFVVFFIAATFILHPRHSLWMFVLAELLYLTGLMLYPAVGLALYSHIINSLIVMSLAWTISTMLYTGHLHLFIEKTKIQNANAELARLYVTDRLTGLYNRHKLDEELERQIMRTDRYGNKLTVIMIDIDDFKSVNDEHGHHAGDKALVVISQTIASCVRKTDILGRWGGEEFMIICPETNTQDAYVLADRIREHVSEVSALPERRVTLSLGLTAYSPGEGLRVMLSRCDALLYAAKYGGRNRVEVAGTDGAI